MGDIFGSVHTGEQRVPPKNVVHVNRQHVQPPCSRGNNPRVAKSGEGHEATTTAANPQSC
jgi:hypothetical protein